MSRNRIILGKKGEDLASAYLIEQGYKILEKNFRSFLGEIDLIALDKGVLVFIEIKTRRTKTFGVPQLAVTASKQKKIYKNSLYYLKRKKLKKSLCRFDVVAIDFSSPSPRLELIKNAFQVERAWG